MTVLSPRPRRPVIKIGSTVLTGGSREISLARMADLVEQVARLHRDGARPIVVSSGAVAAGRQRLGFPRDRKDVSLKQVLAAVGQSRLMHFYDQFFEFHGITSAQVLLTRADLGERGRYLNARNTLTSLLERGVVPVINENDVVAAEEIRTGDNDTLSALVANLVDADLLVLVSDIAGLFSADPTTNPDAHLIPEVRSITPLIESYAGGTRSGMGTGGMATKIEAAKLATAAGTEVRLVDGRERDVLLRVLAGEPIGTRFLARSDPLEGRKRWILSGLNRAGQIAVDAGAAQALLHGGASLLPAGIVAVSGAFARGDPVDVVTEDGLRIAGGMANYDGEETRRILGHRSTEIEGILGYSYGNHVVHRNDLVPFPSEERTGP